MRDFIDHYLHEVELVSEKNTGQTSFHGKEGLLNLENVLVGLFIAGSETTSTTLNWGMLYMILHPEIQKKVSKSHYGFLRASSISIYMPPTGPRRT